MALLLKRRGIERIRPLAGGLEAWSSRGYPLETRRGRFLEEREG